MATAKVYSVYARNGYTGPWRFVNWYASKRDAEAERQRLRYLYSETKLLREFEYEARSRPRAV